MRDRLLAGWNFSETANEDVDKLRDFGSGYPSDPKCKDWMDNNPLKNCVFGYPDILRFSWAPSKQRLEETAVSVIFRADLDENDEELNRQRKGMASFLGGIGKKHKRSKYFEERNIRVCKSLT
jgi:ribonuclease H2 subunit A